MISLELGLSVVATVLATLAFGREVWRTWRDRPRLRFYVARVAFKNVPHFGDFEQMRILICNVGYRPLILVRFRAFGENGAFTMGIDDEPAAALGIADRRFPSFIEPGGTLAIHPVGVAALERNQTDPKDDKVLFDPWKVFVLEDSFGRYHAIEAEDVLAELRIGQSWTTHRGFGKIGRSIKRWFFRRRARKRWSQD